MRNEVQNSLCKNIAERYKNISISGSYKINEVKLSG